MSIFGKAARAMMASAAVMLLGAPAMAQQQVVVIVATVIDAPVYMARSAGEVGTYRYGSRENYCPAGLQPVTVDGTISCGAPNRYQSYQQAMRHPAPRVRRETVRHYSARANCAVGTKGCW